MSTYRQLIGKTESIKREWKPSLAQIHEIVNTIEAFANTAGGRILIGVSKTGCYRLLR